MKTLALLICTFCLGSAWAANCDSIPNSAEILRPGVVVLLGEIHGTNEAPAIVSALICEALEKGLDVTVGLEISFKEQGRLDRFLASAGSDSDRAELISGDFWQRDYQDGRGSQAMVKLIEAMRIFRSDTSNTVRVVMLDNMSAPKGRDHFMAEQLATEISKTPRGFFIALTGNVHSRITKGSGYNDEYEPMGYLLTQMSKDAELIPLEMSHTGGTAWICEASAGCGVLKLRGGGGGQGIELLENVISDPYLGYFNVGAITASLPAKDQ